MKVDNLDLDLDLDWISEEDSVTREALEANPGMAGELREALRKRMEAAEMERDAKALKAESNEALQPLMLILGVNKVQTTVGTAATRAGVTVTYSMEKVKESLLSNHVAMVVIEQAERAGKKETAWETVEWRWAKGRGK